MTLLTKDVTKVVWVDVNSRPWHLAGPGVGAEGVIWGADPKGLMFPPHEILSDAGARQDGATPRRPVVSKKDLDFNVSIGNLVGLQIRDYRHWQQVHALWWRGWSRRKPGHLCIFTRGKGWRKEPFYLADAPEPHNGLDPARNLNEVYTLSATGFEPFWAGLEREVKWVNTSGSNQGVLKMRNDASEEAWPRYTLKGPGRYFIQDFDPAADPDADLRMMTIPTLVAGETARIDLHPRHRTARVYNASGVYLRNIWGQMAGRRFLNPIQPWGTTEINVAVEGGDLTSEVVGTLTPLDASPL
ncbi:phage tail protein [Nocardia sp. NPDC019255]|uniref:phage tail protein n=1 Tax=Nocardia sp. NPDC019255 TaxID=3154591 RepID=UPI0033C14158